MNARASAGAAVLRDAETVACSGCGALADACYALRDECCKQCSHYPDADVDVDEVAVLRAVGGDMRVPLNRQEIAEVWRRLEARKLSAAAIADVLGTTDRTVQRWRDGDVALPYSRPAGGFPMTTPPSSDSGTDALLRRASQSDSAKVRAAATRAQRALDRLREAFAQDEGKRAVRERVAKLEADLRAARAELRGGGRSVPATGGRRTGGSLPCRKGCGQMSASGPGRASHERHCKAAS